MARSAFDFSPQVSILFKIATKKTISKTNVVLLAMDTAVSLIDLGCAYVRYSEVKKQTIELNKQAHILKDVVDEEIKQKKIQIESDFHLLLEELLKDLNEQRRTLQLNAEKVRLEMSIKIQKGVQDSERGLKKLDLLQLAIIPIKDTLGLYDKLMQLPKTGSFKQFAELEEQHRICLQKYTYLRTQFI